MASRGRESEVSVLAEVAMRCFARDAIGETARNGNVMQDRTAAISRVCRKLNREAAGVVLRDRAAITMKWRT